jgi:hypothetical protein
MQGIKKTFGKEAVSARGLTKGLLKGLINAAIGEDLDGTKVAPLKMWREAWREVACFLTCLRFSDMNRGTRAAVYFEGNMVRIVFKSRKNDPYNKGHTVFLFQNDTRYCPVRLTKLYFARLPRAPDTYVLGDLSGKNGPATYGACRKLQIALLIMLDFDPEPYGLHSARVGGMEYLEEGKISVADMNFVVGWAEGSVMGSHYARASMAKYLAVARRLALKPTE